MNLDLIQSVLKENVNRQFGFALKTLRVPNRLTLSTSLDRSFGQIAADTHRQCWLPHFSLAQWKNNIYINTHRRKLIMHEFFKSLTSGQRADTGKN
jgi:hypothetical protein